MEGGGYDSLSLSFSLSLEMENDYLKKVMGTLTTKRVFIGPLIVFKWLDPITGSGHLM